MGRPVVLSGADEELAVAREAAQALDFIERVLFEPLTVERIARHCGTSSFHFSRRFTVRQGESVMAYVRGRRLDVAAQRLTGNPKISLAELALDCGFETQAAFTRAFTRAFGAPPGEFRCLDNPPARKRRLRMSEPVVLHESVVDERAIRLAGLAGRFEPSTFVTIADMWKRFSSYLGFAGQLGDGETVGAFRDRDRVGQGFEHLAGVRVSGGASVPDGLVVWELPAQTWLKYRQPMTGAPLHVQMMAAQAEIHGVRLPQTGRRLRAGPDLQIYAAKFEAKPGWWVEHWLPVE